jgi:hypothetical protein
MDHSQNFQHQLQVHTAMASSLSDQQQQHHQHHQQPLSPHVLQQQQQQQQPQDGRPQDVLAEARKNLQMLIDSGMSKDLLHQLVDGSQSLQLIAPSLQSSLAHLQQPLPQQPLPQQPMPPPMAMPTHPPPPPPPQCPPPPPPVDHQRVNTPVSVPEQIMSTAPQETKATSVTVSEDMGANWSAAPQPLMSPGLSEAEQALFTIPPAMPFNHRPRISVSSTASGSSGHASIWSTGSGHSALSWRSASTAPQNNSTLSLHTIGAKSTTSLQPPGSYGMGGSSMSAAANASKQNIYWCTSCETSFKRKYDWKRHEDEFHERWRKYPCPEPGCNRSFWGSNSFNQHHKQCHGCKTCPHAEKVVKFLRKRKYWACGFCSALHPARERHVEHVARHFESGLTKTDWMHSRVVYGLLHQPLIHEAWEALVVSKQSEYGGRRPQFSWHPSKTGRAQGFLEKENPGQLQDLLEFFSGDEGEAQWIVSVAYKLADIVMTMPPPAMQSPTQAFTPESITASPFSQDGRMSFATLPSQAIPQLPVLPSSDQSGQQSPFSPFRSPAFLPSQQIPSTTQQQPSPESSTQSPVPSQSPMGPSSHSPHEKRELPAPPSGPVPSTRNDNRENLMDYEFSPSAVVFDDWESINGVVMDDTTPPVQHAAPSQHNTWGMVQYFNDPRISS